MGQIRFQRPRKREPPTRARNLRHLPREVMLDSVRVRLTLWFSGVMTGVLIAMALATYIAIRQNAVRRTDASLSELAESFLTTLSNELRDEPGPDAVQNAGAAAIAEHSFHYVLFFVLDDQQRILLSSHAPGLASGAEDEVHEFLLRVNRTSSPHARAFHNAR